MNGKTQNDAILEHLKAGNRITPLDALNRFGSLRLGARIYELKQAGHKITGELIEIQSTGKRVMEYRLC